MKESRGWGATMYAVILSMDEVIGAGVLFGAFLFFLLLLCSPFFLVTVIVRDWRKSRKWAKYWRDKWRDEYSPEKETLLRPAAPPSNAILLRPVKNQEPGDPEILLRPADKE
jgi:hypothetical protein